MAGVILKSQFSVKNFSGYVDYITKDEIENEKSKQQEEDKETLQHLKKSKNKSLKSFSNYAFGYMNNKKLKKKKNGNTKKVIKRTTGSFNDEKDLLDKDDIKKLKKDFDTAERNECVNYQDIISFDNDFLEKNNLYNPETDELNEEVIKDATRKMVERLHKEENLNPDNTRWIANIHYDTDNIHIHVTTVEIENTRPLTKSEKYEGQVRGKRSEKTLSNMKSAFVNSLLDNKEYLKEVSNRRDQLYKDMGVTKATGKQQALLNNILKRLPNEKYKWQYNNKEVKPIQPLIDQYTEDYIKKHHKESFKEYQDAVKSTAEFYKEAYGENSKADEYIKNKNKEINQRMGNKLLKSLKTIDDLKQLNMEKKNEKFKQMNPNSTFKPYQKPIITKKDMYLVNRAITNEMENYNDEMQHEALKRKIEYEQNRSI